MKMFKQFWNKVIGPNLGPSCSLIVIIFILHAEYGGFDPGGRLKKSQLWFKHIILNNLIVMSGASAVTFRYL